MPPRPPPAPSSGFLNLRFCIAERGSRQGFESRVARGLQRPGPGVRTTWIARRTKLVGSRPSALSFGRAHLGSRGKIAKPLLALAERVSWTCQRVDRLPVFSRRVPCATSARVESDGRTHGRPRHRRDPHMDVCIL